jgi:hypothetical protein
MVRYLFRKPAAKRALDVEPELLGKFGETSIPGIWLTFLLND